MNSLERYQKVLSFNSINQNFLAQFVTVLTEKIKLLKINFHGNTVISQQTLQAHENIVHGIKLGKIIV